MNFSQTAGLSEHWNRGFESDKPSRNTAPFVGLFALFRVIFNKTGESSLMRFFVLFRNAGFDFFINTSERVE